MRREAHRMHRHDAGPTAEGRRGAAHVAGRPVHDHGSPETTVTRGASVSTEGDPMTRDDADQQRIEDARVAHALSDQVAQAVLVVLDRYQHLAGPHGRVFLRYVILHAVTTVLGMLLKDAIDTDADRATPWARETVARLEAFVAPRSSKLH
jgi:hypothetical protein